MDSEPHAVVSAVTLPRPAPRALRLDRDPAGVIEDPVRAEEETGGRRPSPVRRTTPATRVRPIPSDGAGGLRHEGGRRRRSRELSDPMAERPGRSAAAPVTLARASTVPPCAHPPAPVRDEGTLMRATYGAARRPPSRDRDARRYGGTRPAPASGPETAALPHRATAHGTRAGSARHDPDDLDRARQTRYKVGEPHKTLKVVFSTLRPPTCSAGHLSYPNTDSLHIGVDESVL